MDENTKHPQVEALLNEVAKDLFGHSRDGKQCVICGSEKIKPEDFKDDLSRREFRISKMCQVCQDDVFGGE
jgi:hypothetical protein